MPRTVKLTLKQERFCEEYLIDLNATAAAKRAGFSAKSAMEQGYALINKPQVKAKISELKMARSERTEITADRVLAELGRVAFADLGKAYSAKGDLLPVPDMPDDIRLVLAGADIHMDITDGVEVGETRKIKLLDKLRALELIGKHLKLFTEKVEHSGKFSLEDLVTNPKEDEPK